MSIAATTSIGSTNSLSAISAASNAVSTKDNESLKKLSSDYTTFLKLLTTQLQYQDPTNPTDSNTFTQQLVQYSQVEQQIKTNDKLTTLVDTTKTNGNSNAALLNYIGRYAEVNGSNLALQNGVATGTYQLASAANAVKLEIQDSAGATKATFTGPTGAGLQKVAWDGKDNSGKVLADGTYTLKITATDAKGNAIAVEKQSWLGLVTGVQRTDSGAVLNIGALQTKEADVINIYNKASDKAA